MAPVANSSATDASARGTAPNPTAARHEQQQTIRVASDRLTYSPEYITAQYEYQNTHIERQAGADGVEELVARPYKQEFEFRTKRALPKTGLMLVGLGGNNGTTITATILANRHNVQWHNKDGLQTPNYYGSLVRASTIRLGSDASTGKDVWVPFSNVLPMVHPNDFVVGGWDISGLPLDKAMERAKVLDYDLQRQVAPMMAEIKPLPSVYYPDFIAANQEERADNVIPGTSKKAHVEQLRQDIRAFKREHGLDRWWLCGLRTRSATRRSFLVSTTRRTTCWRLWRRTTTKFRRRPSSPLRVSLKMCRTSTVRRRTRLCRVRLSWLSVTRRLSVATISRPARRR